MTPPTAPSTDAFLAELATVLAEESARVSVPLLQLLHRGYGAASLVGDSLSGYQVLNEAASLLAVDRWRPTAWRFYRELATRAGETGDALLKTALTISLFEVIAEPPWIGLDVELLFTLLEQPTTRWAVFAAYRRYPRTLLRHLRLYGRGRLTGAE